MKKERFEQLVESLGEVRTHVTTGRFAGRISKGFAIVLALLAILQLNPFLLFIAIFIYLAVSAETTMTHLEDLLHGVPVRNMMNRDVKTVFTDTPLAEVTQRMLEDRHLGFPVLEHEGRVAGMVTLDEIRGQDPNLPVAQVMKKDVPTWNQDDEATAALRLMTQNDFGRLPVVADDGHLIGIVSKTDLLRVIQLRAISRDWTGNGQLPYHVSTARPHEAAWEPAGRASR
jgi:CBS domain-containing protein